MTAKTAAERFDAALAEIKKLQDEGYDCGPVHRLSLSATGKVKEPEPEKKAPAKAPFSLSKADKSEDKS
ncbi:MAG: hypothetical protein KAH44_12740 [Oricola sp.]|jgi:hypothetical protein|nr:hypothetical protein [Oricola sp.]